MKHRTGLWLALLAVLLLTVPAWAIDGLTLPRHHVAGGGGRSIAGPYTIHAAIGQAITGLGRVGNVAVCAGFWCHAGRYAVYLPLVLRDF